MTKPLNFVPWPDGVPPDQDRVCLPFALRRMSRRLGTTSNHVQLVLMLLHPPALGLLLAHPVLRSFDGHSAEGYVSYRLDDCIARFEFLPPLPIVEALAESLGLTLVWPDVAEGDEPSGQEDAA